MEIAPPRRSYLIGIGFTSLTDIVLLLLIFFLLSSSFVLRPGLAIRLPEGEASESVESAPLSVTLTEEGAVFLDQMRVDGFSGLEEALPRALASRGTGTIVLEAERGVALEHAVRVLDLARMHGDENLVIATEQKGHD